MKDLRVKVPKYFRESLEERFDFSRREKKNDLHVINAPCLLCLIFIQCKSCPFAIEGKKGCVSWIIEVLGGELDFYLGLHRIFWYEGHTGKSKKQLEKLRERSKELIEWI